MDSNDPSDAAPIPLLCDWCGTALGEDEALHAYVEDSSRIHARNPRYDGRRPVMTCSQEHLRHLHSAYAKRPFIEEELWAGKLDRAFLQADTAGLPLADLTRITELTEDQIALAIRWRNSNVPGGD